MVARAAVRNTGALSQTITQDLPMYAAQFAPLINTTWSTNNTAPAAYYSAAQVVGSNG